MLRRALTVSLVLSLFLAAQLRADDASKAQDKDLEGKWRASRWLITVRR